MKCIVCFGFLFFCFFPAFAQKKPIDHAAVTDWPEIKGEKISNNGEYVIYKINSEQSGSELIIQATSDVWKREFQLTPSFGNEFFTSDSKRLIFAKSDDTIGIMNLDNKKLNYLTNVSSCQFGKNGNGRWLVYQLKDDSSKSVYFYNLYNAEKKRISQIIKYVVSDNGEVVVLQHSAADGLVIWIDLEHEKSKVIDHHGKVARFVINPTGDKVVFFKEGTDASHSLSVMYYRSGLDSARTLVDHSTLGMDGFDIKDQFSASAAHGEKNKYFQSPFLSRDGRKFFFRISKRSNKMEEVIDTLAKVDVWGYRDKFLRGQQRGSWDIGAVINLDKPGKIIRLQKENDEYPLEIAADGNGKYVLVQGNVEGDTREANFHFTSRPNIYLVSTEDGSRKMIKSRLIIAASWIQFSPMGDFVVWFDRVKHKWFSYNIKDGDIKDLSGQIPVSLVKNQPDFQPNPICDGIGGWIDHENDVLLYDDYDIWKIDVTGSNKPVNITHGYGRKNKIVFRYMDFKSDSDDVIQNTDTLLLSAFNIATKERGFYNQPLTSVNRPRRLTMGSFSWNLNVSSFGNDFTMSNYIPKARDNNSFILRRMKDTVYPNLYFTRDFRTFTPLTSLAPQKKYNWYTNELIHWELPNGKSGEGILYKPQNFDPKKKYPIIFSYYEQSADHLNLFLAPDLSNGVINITWFASHGYIVCVPDIHYKLGYPGESALKTVVSCAKYLSKQRWVNAHKMGLQGKSFGGFETDYIITHSNLFVAACSSSAPTDIISEYGRMLGGYSMHYFYENAQGRIGATLWQKPDLYINNSPIFMADKVTTPLLMMNNKNDPIIFWDTEAAPWFTALRRLGKKVWMLQYDGEGHSINDPVNRKDFTVRLSQFFDYYLKDARPPKWMTQGIPAAMKGRESGLELDTSGTKP